MFFKVYKKEYRIYYIRILVVRDEIIWTFRLAFYLIFHSDFDTRI
jgi:hypothetical protein